LTIPRFGIVGFAVPLEIERYKNDEPFAVFLPQVVGVFVPAISQSAVETGTNRNLITVHERDVVIPLFGGMSRADEEMRVDIDHRKFRPGQMVFRDLQLRFGTEVF